MPDHSAVSAPVRRDSTRRTILVSLAICFACSVAVSISTVLLRPIRSEHARLAREARVREMLSRQPGLSGLVGDLPDVDLEQWVVELATGARAPEIDPASFDPQRAATDPGAGRVVPAERDIARIKHQARHAVVTVVRRADVIQTLVLPVFGRGYASVIHATVAIAADGKTIQGLTIDRHGETPGIGSEIEEPEWLRQFSGKQALDEEGLPTLEVVTDEPSNEPARSRVDFISGATRSSLGVGRALRFWLGEDGYGPFLARVRSGEHR